MIKDKIYNPLRRVAPYAQGAECIHKPVACLVPVPERNLDIRHLVLPVIEMGMERVRYDKNLVIVYSHVLKINLRNHRMLACSDVPHVKMNLPYWVGIYGQKKPNVPVWLVRLQLRLLGRLVRRQYHLQSSF